MDDRRRTGGSGPRGGPPRVSQSARQRLSLKDELLLALLPTLAVLAVIALLEIFSQERLLFASLASSAFLIYLDPHHGMNTIRNLSLSHFIAAASGLLTFLVFGHGYAAAATAMIVTILLTVLLDVVHPPAVSTSLIFGLRDGSEHDIVLFGLALAMIIALVLLQRAGTWLLVYLSRSR